MSETNLQSPRGTQDFFGLSSQKMRWIENAAAQLAQNFAYEEIQTPIFEADEVFHRTLGETSDAVTKETYTFLDRGGDKITLRPEGTAPVVRAYLSNSLTQINPFRVIYRGPMFRYERPQKGRYRQFHQIGVESLGSGSPAEDIECLSFAFLFLKNLGLTSQLEINSLGDQESRERHREAFVNFLRPFQTELSADSQTRLQKNPLRILDSKNPNDQKILENAPRLSQHLNDLSRKHFDDVLKGLDGLGIPFMHNEKLVRGFDYYTHTVFEFTTQDLGAQNALLSGGRYNRLVEMMGGTETPGIGWACGLERLMLLLPDSAVASTRQKFALIPASESENETIQKLTYDLRAAGFSAEAFFTGNFSKKMKKADRAKCTQALIVGETERAQDSVIIKNLSSGEQTTLPRTALHNHLKNSKQ